MTTTTKPLRVGIIGPAGFGGSHLSLELINRGHTVVGISRSPERLGTHERYEPRSLNVDTASVAELAKAFSDLDVLVSAYAPQNFGAGAGQYKLFLETMRKFILAVKRANVGYFSVIAGASSLHLSHNDQGEEEDICAVDSKDFTMAYRRAIADSNAHVSYMEERLGPMVASLRAYRDARITLRENEGTDTAAAQAVVDQFESQNKEKDMAADFIQAAVSMLMFFEGNTSFSWTFVSPGVLYRPGKRTGQYKAYVRNVPLKPESEAIGSSDNRFDGRLTGITVPDMAIAIADDVESQEHKHQHWTAVGDLSDDTPAPTFVTL